MASEHILRIPRSDSEGDFVLVSVSTNGPSPLDLKLLATEGTNPYICLIKQTRISKLRAKHSPLLDNQWETVLLSTLLQRRSHGDPSEIEALDKLELITTITGDQIVLIFRKNISGITQRLGEIALTKDEDVEIDPTAWAGSAVARANNLEQEVQDLNTKYEGHGQTIQKLNEQLEDLIQAKREHETALLEKFRELLNSKKLKIRDQQRLLAGAKVDPQKAARIHTSRHPSALHTPTASRSTKRKAKNSATSPSPSPSSSSDEFDNSTKQNLATAIPEHDSPEPAQATPQHSSPDATEDEGSDDLDSAPAPVPAPPSQGAGVKGKVMERAEETASTGGQASKVSEPPPPRELPFARKDGGSGVGDGKAVKVHTKMEGDRDGGDETSDDEL